MTMTTSESVRLPAPPASVYPLVVDLGTYPTWLPLVHHAEPDGADAWIVELRAQVGPFARSKRLRMTRTDAVPDVSARFERDEVDGRDHASWVLQAELSPSEDGTVLTMHLAYGGRLWTAGVLERVLDDEVRRGRAGLTALLERP